MSDFTEAQNEVIKYLNKKKQQRKDNEMSTKIIKALKSINYKDLAMRAFWTFLQGFLAVVLLTSDQFVELIFAGNLEALKALAIATLVGGVAAGLSALKTAILSFIKKYKTL